MKRLHLPEPLLRSIMLVDEEELDMYVNTIVIQGGALAERVIKQPSPIKALEYLAEVEQLPDVIMLDMHCKEMDGMDFIEKFEALPEHISGRTQIITLSARFPTRQAHREKVSRYKSVIGSLNKPVNSDLLEDIIRKKVEADKEKQRTAV